MNFKNGTLYIIHDEIPDDDIGWKLYSPKLFYVWNDKKYNIINRASAWTEKIIKNKPTGTYEVSNKVPSSISSQILPIIQFKENKMTMKQKQLIENYIRIKVKKSLKENDMIRDYKWIDAAEDAIYQAYERIQKFNDSEKTTSSHPNIEAIKKKMYQLEEYLDKFGNQVNKLRNKF